MKSWSVCVITTAVILLTGFVLQRAGWFGSRAQAAGPDVRTAPREALSSSVALKHARCQPQHWRDCMLAR